MKRKLLQTAITAVILTLFFTLCAGAVTLGDIDGDGKRDSSDARLTLRASVKLENYAPGSPQFTAADADGNGVLEASDARTILRASVKLDPLPEDPAEVIVSKDYRDPVNSWAEYDALIAQIKAENDYAKRTELMHQAEDILMSTHCVIPIYYYNDVYLQKDYVKGVYSNPYGTKFFMYGSMDNGSDTLRLNLGSEPAALDPALNSSVDGACLIANSFSGLYTYDAEGRTIPACAESCTVSPDGLTYTVTLKKGLKWSDGSTLTAADFAYSWKRAVDPETSADYQYLFSGFDGYLGPDGTFKGDINVTALDETTLRFVLTAPCAYMEDLMAFPTFYPVKKETVENDPDWETFTGSWALKPGFVSNGAYVCTGWDHEHSMTYEKNPYFYNADQVTIEKLEVMLSEDDIAVFAAYNAGSLDFTDNVPYDRIDAFLQSDNDELHIVNELGTYYIAFNANSDLFKGKTPEQAACIRQAVSLLIDRDYICETIGQTGQVAANTFVPLGMADGNGGVFHKDAYDGYYDAYAIDRNADQVLGRARQLLVAAGYEFGSDGKLSKDTPLTIPYLTNKSEGHIAIAEAIRLDLGELGIGMTIQSVEWNQFLISRGEGDFTLAREGWIADFNDPINMLEMFTTDSGNNDCQFGRFEGWDD